MRTLAALCLLLSLAVPAFTADAALDQANQLLSEKKWTEAKAAFSHIAEADPQNGAAWTGLGEAHLQTKMYPEAKAAFSKALAAKYRPLISEVNLARVAAAAGDKAELFRTLQAIADSPNGPNARPFLNGYPEFTPFLQDATFRDYVDVKLKPCTAEAFHLFDFWVGKWKVQDLKGNPLGANEITREQDGCLLVEHWKSGRGYETGSSFNYYDINDKKWHQVYISNGGNAGAYPPMAGTLQGNAMVLITDNDPQSISRWTWTPLPENKVRQTAEFSSDGGKTWAVTWDSIYVKAAD